RREGELLRLLHLPAQRLRAAPQRPGDGQRDDGGGERGRAVPSGGPMRSTRLALALLALTAGLVSAATDDGPRVVVKRMTDAALNVLRDKSLSSDDKRRRLEDVVFPEVDFDTMSRLVLGRNWSRFSAAQQAEFVKQFREHLSMTYGRNIDNYRNERVEVVGDQDEGRGDWVVKTKILRGGGAEDILVDYR